MCLEVGEPIIIQEPIYPATTSVVSKLRALLYILTRKMLKLFLFKKIEPLNARMIPVQQDKFGLVPEALRAALEKEGSAAHIRSKTKGVPKV